MKKAITVVAMTLLYVFVLLVTYYLHTRFFTVDVVFYSAIFDALIAAVVVALLVFALPGLAIGPFEKSLLVVIWILGGYAFAITIPALLDRSLSFYILEKLQQRGGGIKAARFVDVFTGEYVAESRLVDIRLTEQLQSGTITIDSGCVRLTERGERLASLSRFFRLHFLPRHRLLAGEYTDALVDPFAHSPPGPMGYEC